MQYLAIHVIRYTKVYKLVCRYCILNIHGVSVLKQDEIEVAKALMRKFHRHDRWGAGHWREDTLPKGFPGHLRGKVMDVAEKLRKMGFLVKRPSSHGYQWYANIERLQEIEEFIK